jgi:transcriptional regulator with GAF, ATPase, and Fis domain
MSSIDMDQSEELDLFRRIDGIGCSLDLREVLDRLLTEGLKIAEYDRGDIRLIDRNTGELVLWSSLGPLTTFEPKRVSAQEGISGRALRSREPLTVPNVHQDPDYISLLEKYEGTDYAKFLRSFRSAVKVPILGSDGAIGIFCAHSPDVNTLSEEKVRMLERLMRRATWAVTNAQMHEEAAYILRVRQEIDRAAVNAKDLNSLLDSILTMTLNHLGCKQGLIRLVDEKTRLLIRAAAKGLALETIPLTMEMGAGIVGEVADTGKSALVDDTDEHAGFRQRRQKYSRPEYKEFLQGIKSMVAAAFCAEGQVIGVLMAHKDQINGFSQDDKRILEQIAGYASIPVRNAMHHQTAHSLQEMTVQFRGLLADLSDERKALNDLLNSAMDLTRCRAGHISIVDGEEIKPLVAVGLLDDALPMQKGDDGIEGRALSTGEIQFVPYPQEDPDFQRFLSRLPVNQADGYKELYDVLVVPLVAGGIKYGVISLHSINPSAPPAIIGSLMEGFAGFGAMLMQQCRFLQDRKHDAQVRAAYSRNMDKAMGFGELVGESQAGRELREQIEKHSQFDTTVLLLGEPGVGKNLVAKLIHEGSRRRSKVFWQVDCAGMSTNLAESDLFGAERGAFTDRRTDYAGAFEVADGGTLFLNEIGEADLVIQKKLLRFFDSREFERLGSKRVRKSDVRIIAATNRDLNRMVEEGTFRSDLRDRIAAFEVRVPALRERREDILPLVKQFLEESLKEFNGHKIAIDEGAQRLLYEYDWPGNVRVLRQVVQALVVNAVYSRIELVDRAAALKVLPSGFPAILAGDGIGLIQRKPAVSVRVADSEGTSNPLNYTAAKDVFDKTYHDDLLRKTNGNVSAAATLAGESVKNFRRKMKKHGIKTKTASSSAGTARMRGSGT